MAYSVLVVVFGLGVGANAAMVGALDHLLLRPPPGVRQPDKLVRLLRRSAGSAAVASRISYPMFLELRRDATAFASLAVYSPWRMSYGRGASRSQVRATVVSPEFFHVLGTRASAGRLFGPGDGYPADDAAGGPALVVISHEFRVHHLGSLDRVTGRAVQLDGKAYTIVGVAEPHFRGIEETAPDVWVPISVAVPGGRSIISLSDQQTTWLTVVGRLRNPALADSAAAQADHAWAKYGAALGASPSDSSGVIAASVIRDRSPDAPREARITFWLTGVSLLVLVLACATVTNILLVRAVERRPEISLRVALGATPWRIVRQFLVEAVAVALLGGLVALGVALMLGALLTRFSLVNAADGTFVDFRLLALIFLIALVASTAINVGPVVHALRSNVAGSLRGDYGGPGLGRKRLHFFLLATQGALCLLLLLGAGMFSLSLGRIENLDLGVDMDRTVAARFDLSGLVLPKPAIDSIIQEIVAGLQRIPGVRSVALAESDPYRAGRAVAAHTPRHDADFYWRGRGGEVPMEAAVDSGFFGTVGARSLRGRDFTGADNSGGRPVAIINTRLAEILFPGEDALGKCIILPRRADDVGGACVTVVGVLEGYWRRSILNRDALTVYVPLDQRTVRRGLGRPTGVYLSIRGDAAAIAEQARRAIQRVRPDIPAVTVTTMQESIEPEVRPWRAAVALFGLFGMVALCIATVGLYGSVSVAVVQRMPELALLLALGARDRRVVATVLAESVGAVATGLVVGLAVIGLAHDRVSTVLFQTSPTDPWLLAGAIGVLLVATIAGTWKPVRRALQIPPAQVLRGD